MTKIEIKSNVPDFRTRKNKIDKKISRQGISAEVFGKYNQKKAFEPKVIKKS